MTDANTNIVPANEAINQTGELVVPSVTSLSPVNPARATKLDLVPEYMRDDFDDSSDIQLMQEYVTPPMARIVQSLSPDEAKRFGEGALYTTPSYGLIIPAPPIGQTQSGYARFVPIFFFPEYIAWEQRGVKPQINARTYDPNSQLAKICKKFKPEERNFPDPATGRVLNRQEHLNFIIMFLEGELAGTPMLISFAKSAHKCGRTLCETILMRRNSQGIQPYGQVYELATFRDVNDRGDKYWKPSVRSAVDDNNVVINLTEEWYLYSRDQRNHFKELYDNRMLVTDLDSEDNEQPTAAANAATGQF